MTELAVWVLPRADGADGAEAMRSPRETTAVADTALVCALPLEAATGLGAITLAADDLDLAGTVLVLVEIGAKRRVREEGYEYVEYAGDCARRAKLAASASASGY